MNKGDIHIHTSYSDGIDEPKYIVKYAMKKHMNILSITDHNTTLGYYKLISQYGKKYFEKQGLIIVPGIEITVKIGHILILGLEHPLTISSKSIKNEDDLIEFVEFIKSMFNSLAILAHPYSCKGISKCSIVKNNDMLKLIDGVEVINGRTLPKKNIASIKLAKRIAKPITTGSDAHRAEDVGIVYMIFLESVNSEEDVFKCIKKNKIVLSSIPTALTVFKNIIELHINRISRMLTFNTLSDNK